MHRRQRYASNQEQSLLAALSDPIRHQIVRRLSRQPQSVGSLALHFPVVRAAISRHLKVLLTSGLVACRRDGSRNVYSVRREPLEQLGVYLRAISLMAVREDELAGD